MQVTADHNRVPADRPVNFQLYEYVQPPPVVTSARENTSRRVFRKQRQLMHLADLAERPAFSFAATVLKSALPRVETHESQSIGKERDKEQSQ